VQFNSAVFLLLFLFFNTKACRGDRNAPDYIMPSHDQEHSHGDLNLQEEPQPVRLKNLNRKQPSPN
jgi:hypothetical protein